MAPQDESLPLVDKHGSGGFKRSLSSIQLNLGPESHKGTASLLNVGINLAKTAGKKENY